MPVKVTINGTAHNTEKGEYLLAVLRRNKALVPSLCHHEGLPGRASCRLCVVEVDEGGGSKVVNSCVYPVSRDCTVLTESDLIKRIRIQVLSMLRSRAPKDKRINSLCSMYKVPETKRYKPVKSGDCVLCGLCSQACAELGTGAISTMGRGTGKKVATPYDEPSVDCVGCASCAAICPTGAISCSEKKGARTIWKKNFKLLRCESCQEYFATKEEFEHARARSQSTDTRVICPECRKKKTSDVFASAFGERV